LEKAMLRQIMIQAEPCEDAESMFRLSIDATLIAKGVTVGQACYLVSEILGRMGAQDAETMSFDADEDAEMGHETEGEPDTLEVQAASLLKVASPR
jgi:hypothetical protein